MLVRSSLLLIFLFFPMLIYAQLSFRDSLIVELEKNKLAEEKVKILHSLSKYYRGAKADSALIYSKKALNICIENDLDSLRNLSYSDIADAYTNLDETDSTKMILLTALRYNQERNNYKKIATTYRNLASIFEQTQEPDSIFHYVGLCMDILDQHPDSTLLGDALYSEAFGYQMKGYNKLAIESILQATRIFEKKKDDFKLGFMQHMLGLIFNNIDNQESSLEWNLKSIDNWEKRDYRYALVHAYNNTGSNYRRLKNYALAVNYFKKSNTLCQEVENPYVEMLSANNLGEAYYDLGDIDSAKVWLDIAEELANKLENPSVLATANLVRSKIAIDNNSPLSAKYLNITKENIYNHTELSVKITGLDDLSQHYASIGRKGQAYDLLLDAKVLGDSLFSEESTIKIEELNLIYETEKKDAAIKLLNKEAELDAIRRKALMGGIGLLVLLSGGIIYGQYQRRKRAAEKAQNERQLEIQKRNVVEQQLEFKKKELTAKALLLAKKNEFLQSLEHEVADLQSSVDNAVGKTSSKITRMIQRDIIDDEAWDQFGKEFSSVHQEFLNRIREQYGKFTKGEMRLISLLRMNMNSKDIASILGVSNQGVKKARYRLRKKMNLESDDDIQGLIVGL